MIKNTRFPSYSKVHQSVIRVARQSFAPVLCLAFTWLNLHAAPTVNSEAIRSLARLSQGFPRAELQMYRGDQAAVEVLKEMLQDESEKSAWPTVVTMIGYLSPFDNALANRLVNYLESSAPFRDCPSDDPESFRTRDRIRKTIGREEYEPKLNVLIALGYMLAKPPEATRSATSRLAMRSYLSDGMGPSFWQTRVRWFGNNAYMSTSFRNQLLSRNAEIGFHLAASKEFASRQQRGPRSVSYSNREAGLVPANPNPR